MLLAPEARRRGLTLDLRLGTDIGQVCGDRTQLDQVLINLLLNAMDALSDAEPERRVVSVDALRTDAHVRVSVHDRGKGIAPEELPKVFDSFYSTKPHGMGLGLAIVRTIVEAHGGRIDAASSPEAGTIFSFELPLLAGATTAAA